MSTTSIPVCHTRQELHRQEDAVFNSIPGMDMLRSASPKASRNWKYNTRMRLLP